MGKDVVNCWMSSYLFKETHAVGENVEIKGKSPPVTITNKHTKKINTDLE